MKGGEEMKTFVFKSWINERPINLQPTQSTILASNPHTAFARAAKQIKGYWGRKKIDSFTITLLPVKQPQIEKNSLGNILTSILKKENVI